MRRLPLLLALGLALVTRAASAQQADPLKAAADALSVDTINTLQFTAAGTAFQVGQNFVPAEAWPPVLVKTHTVAINFGTSSLRLEQVRDVSLPQPRGGGAPFAGGEQRQIQVVSGDFAWNVPVPPPAPAGAPAPSAPPPVPAQANQLERLLTIWTTPQGFVKAALANQATTKAVPGGTEVSFLVGGKYKVTGLINARHEVARVKTWIDQPIVGDMAVETEYRDYFDFGGIRFPLHIQQKQDGYLALDLAVGAVTPNPPVDIAVPDNVRAAKPAPVTVTSTAIAPGILHLTGGTHHSLVVEMKDHLVVVDLPNGEERALAVLAKAKELVPGKPIRYVVTSHHHWDHLSGIRAGIDEGATIVTNEANRAFLTRVARTSHTIVPDRLAKSRKPLKIQTVGAKGVLTDGTRTIELHTLQNFIHAGDMMVVYLPKEKILAEPDAFTPPATATTLLTPQAAPLGKGLYDNVKRLGLDVQTIVPFHGGRVAEFSELARDVGGN